MKKQLTPDQLEALRHFASRHGRTWRLTLSLMWLDGRDATQPYGSRLRQVRNEFGPRWLQHFQFPKEEHKA